MQSTKSSINLVQTPQLYETFSRIQGKLQISLDAQGDLASDTLDTIYQNLMAGNYILAVGDDIVMIITADQLLTGKRILSVINFWCSNPVEKVPEMESFLHDLARAAKCDKIVFTGRDAWGRLAKSFKADERIFVAEVRDV